jgi:hypothetical protein
LNSVPIRIRLSVLDIREAEMEYESYKQNLETLSQGIAASVDEWIKLSGGVLGALDTACAGKAVDIAGLQDVKASFSAEAGFLKSLPDRIQEYRAEIKGLRKFYAPEEQTTPVVAFAEEPVKAGWFGKKKQNISTAHVTEAAPAPRPTAHSDQRAFNDARNLMAGLDAKLEEIKAEILRVAEASEEAAYGFKTEVVSLNTAIRGGGKDLKKKEARRFFLEDAVAILAERSTQLGLHARVIGRLHSSEFVENPFDE